MTAICTISPTDNKLIKEYPEMTPEEVDRALTLAVATQKKWRLVPIAEKANLLANVAEIFRNRKDELAKICVLEMGKRYVEGVAEAELCADIFQYYADNGAELLKDKVIDTKIGSAFIQYEPIGVIFSVQPWNFPFYQLTRSAAPAVIVGNTILIKHASNVPLAAKTMEEIFRQAGAPDGVYTNIYLEGA